MRNDPPGRRKATPPGGRPGKRPIRFVRYYVHYRTKKLMDAFAYGHKAWPLG